MYRLQPRQGNLLRSNRTFLERPDERPVVKRKEGRNTPEECCRWWCYWGLNGSCRRTGGSDCFGYCRCSGWKKHKSRKLKGEVDGSEALQHGSRQSVSRRQRRDSP